MIFYSIKMRYMGLATLIILTLALYSGCRNEAPDDPLTKKERAWLAAHDGKIVLGHDPNAYPVDFTDEKG